MRGVTRVVPATDPRARSQVLQAEAAVVPAIDPAVRPVLGRSHPSADEVRSEVRRAALIVEGLPIGLSGGIEMCAPKRVLKYVPMYVVICVLTCVLICAGELHRANRFRREKTARRVVQLRSDRVWRFGR